jgi:hypothetical protein
VEDIKTLLNKLSSKDLEDLLIELDGYEQKPVDIETFITDPYFLGNYFEGNFRPYWLDVFKQIYPLAYEIFEGNKFEGHTMLPILDAFKEKYKLNKLIIIADSGLLSNQNLKQILNGMVYTNPP